jgi:LEA14-like dessication related protein
MQPKIYSMPKLILSFTALVLLLMLFSSCGSIEPLSVTKIEDVKLHSFNKGSAALEVTMRVKNPNSYRFKLVDNNLEIFMNKSELGSAKIKEKIVIPKKSEESYTFLIETQFSRLAVAGIPMLISMVQTKQVELKLVGNVKVRSWGISKRFPVEIVEKVNLSKASKELKSTQQKLEVE